MKNPIVKEWMARGKRDLEVTKSLGCTNNLEVTNRVGVRLREEEGIPDPANLRRF